MRCLDRQLFAALDSKDLAQAQRTLAEGAVRFAWDGAPIDGDCSVEVAS